MDSPHLHYSYPIYTQANSPASSSTSSSDISSSYTPPISYSNKKHSTKSCVEIAHPYARLVSKKDEVKRRKIWNHALEKSLFTPYEISTLGAPNRRVIYMASLENHIEELHNQLLDTDFWPVSFQALQPYKGLNSKTAKSMVAGLQHDVSIAKLKLLELERSNADLQNMLNQQR